MDIIDWSSFTQKIPIRSSPKLLFDAWTIPSALEKWFLSVAGFTNEAGEPAAAGERIATGYRYEWQWHLFAGREKGRLLAVVEPATLRFTFAGECIVNVSFEEKEGFTIVTLTQSGIPTDDRAKKEIRLGCAAGWAFYLVNLKSVYEGGLDLRNKTEGLGPMLNN